MRYTLYVKNSFMMVLLLCISCVNTDFVGPTSNCINNFEANITFGELEELYQDEVFQIQNEWFIEGYVVSSDREGNFFNVLHIQDDPTNPSHGIQMEVDLRDSHLFYDVGNKVGIALKGLFLGKSNDLIRLGGTFNAFGNVSVGRLPTLKIPEHLFILCDGADVVPFPTVVDSLIQLPPGILIQLENMEVIDEELGKPYAEPREETVRMLQNCEEIQMEMLTSGFFKIFRKKVYLKAMVP